MDLPGGSATLMRLPGIGELNDGHAALFQAVRNLPHDRVFVAGPGSIATALWASRAGAEIVPWTENAAEARSLQATFEANQQPLPMRHLALDFNVLEPETCELALLHLPRGRERQRELLQAAAGMLRTGSTLMFVGAKQEGIKGAVKIAKRIYGQAGIVTHKGGYHVGMAYRPSGDVALPTVTARTYEISVEEEPTKLLSYPGVFAPDRLDMGTEALIKGMNMDVGNLVLDLGCGTGLAGLAAARRGARTISVDVSNRATASAQLTLQANGYAEAVVHLCCGAAAVPRDTIDTVITNPPFHSGHDVNFEVAQLFVREAARVLKKGGQIYLVANTFLDYESWLRGSFRAVEVAWQDRRFRVWRGQA
jgi:16S rRNA (guanine1207-N2)-methyltransferase